MPSAGVEEPPRDICVRSASVGDKSGFDMMPVTPPVGAFSYQVRYVVLPCYTS